MEKGMFGDSGPIYRLRVLRHRLWNNLLLWYERTFCKFMVVGVDNYCRDYTTEILKAKDLPLADANLMADALNEREGKYSDTYWAVKPNDYVLYVFDGY